MMRSPLGTSSSLSTKIAPLPRKFFDHKAVVDDLFADVDRRPKGLQGDADNIDRPDHARAEAARLQQQ